jgi:hypothetical protein
MQAGQKVHDEERSGHPSLITEDLKKQVDKKIRQDRRLTLDELHEKFPQISRSRLHKILSKHLGYKKICARCCQDDHRKNRMDAALTFLERYQRDRDKLLDRIFTGDETWVSHFTPEIKRQSLVASSSIAFKTQAAEADIVHSEYHGHGFLGLERRPSG